jgi:hypothetical protein
MKQWQPKLMDTAHGDDRSRHRNIVNHELFYSRFDSLRHPTSTQTHQTSSGCEKLVETPEAWSQREDTVEGLHRRSGNTSQNGDILGSVKREHTLLKPRLISTGAPVSTSCHLVTPQHTSMACQTWAQEVALRQEWYSNYVGWMMYYKACAEHHQRYGLNDR